jgi:hypothetical protein
VVLGHRVVVHVRDNHRLRLAGAGRVIGASYLNKSKACHTNNTISIRSLHGKRSVACYLVAGAASLPVLENGLVAAGRHGGEGVLVRVLEPARAACTSITTANTMSNKRSPTEWQRRIYT